MKKTIYTLNINNYAPKITKLTYPLLQKYADKINASFKIITERKFPDWPVVYEKLQIHELGKENDWNIYIDSDCLVFPDMWDITEFIPKDTVYHNGKDVASNRWSYDEYFRRDGRHISSCNWFTVGSDWCLDLWKPLDIPFEQAVKNIHPTKTELDFGMEPSHLIDDYTLSRNIARYGLKHKTLPDIQTQLNDKGNFLFHVYTVSEQEKLKKLTEIVNHWKL